MTDTCAWRNNAEVLKRFLTPTQKLVTLAITLELTLNVGFKGCGCTEFVHHHGVINHQINSCQWVDFLRVAAEGFHGFAHCSQVNNSRNACEILHQNAGRAESDFFICFTAIIQPVFDGFDIVCRNGAVIFKTQQVFQQYFESKRKFVDITDLLGYGL